MTEPLNPDTPRYEEVVAILATKARALHARIYADQQRAHLRNEGYDLDCVCGGCTVCIVRPYIDLVDPPQTTGKHRPPCTDGNYCGEAAHCPPPATVRDAARTASGQQTETVPTPEEGIEDARKVIQHVLQLFLDRVPRNELDAETMADSVTDALSDGLTELYRSLAQAETALAAVGQPAEAQATDPWTPGNLHFLRFALGCAAAVMYSEDDFTDEDHAALDQLRAFAGPEPSRVKADALDEAADEAERENHDCSSLARCQPCAVRSAVAAKLRRMAEEARS